MSLAHASWSPVESTDNPTSFTLRRSNSGLTLAMYPSSVVQTGVKSFGCENSTAHESPIQSWNLIGPSVVSASKSGAVSPSCNAIYRLLSPESSPVCVEIPDGRRSVGREGGRTTTQRPSNLQVFLN